eukprot:scaffold99642_cov63-Phaeocystis_antarctica.AAC.2
MRAVVAGSRCPHRYGAIVRSCDEKTTQNHRRWVAGAISGEAMCCVCAALAPLRRVNTNNWLWTWALVLVTAYRHVKAPPRPPSPGSRDALPS